MLLLIIIYLYVIIIAHFAFVCVSYRLALLVSLK